MSKILKIIVNLVVVIAIGVAAALLVPPFVGVDTVMNDNTETDTNLPVGYVAYGKSVSVKDLEKKDKIIYNDGASTYVYEIADMDVSAGTYKVRDIYNKNSEEESVNLQKSVPKVVVTIPVIGYAAIALQSKEGLLVVGLGIIFLIILFILSELFRKDDGDDDDEEEDEEEEDENEEDEEEDDEEDELTWRERRRLKKEEKRRRRQEEEDEEEEDDGDDEEEEEELSRKERRRLKKEEKRRKKLERKGFLADEEEDEDEEEEMESPSSNSKEESSEAADMEAVLKDALSSVAEGVAEVSRKESISDATMVMPEAKELEEAGAQAFEEEEDAAREISVEDDNNIEETEEEIVVDMDAVPKAPTVEELLQKAEAAGEEPEVKKDEENKVTLLDYSNIL